MVLWIMSDRPIPRTFLFFFNDTATTEIYTLSLHDALPISAKEDGICTAFSPEAVYSPLPAYAELHCLSNFTFLRGASHPEELVKRAAGLGYSALAVTDECSLAGAVRAHVAAKDVGLPLVIGSEIRLQDGPSLVLLATDREGYGN